MKIKAASIKAFGRDTGQDEETEKGKERRELMEMREEEKQLGPHPVFAGELVSTRQLSPSMLQGSHALTHMYHTVIHGKAMAFPLRKREHKNSIQPTNRAPTCISQLPDPAHTERKPQLMKQQEEETRLCIDSQKAE
ncbi:unnamed protein product [Pleuronectes platessa]|uniref:Uncharacterized protein n=1 Tax=Pleuronectes platessa TaxID=8262 RepID=A0A9N7V0G4_PLEPL|nr:unnamed protein product [Pleuronectes platessa]